MQSSNPSLTVFDQLFGTVQDSIKRNQVHLNSFKVKLDKISQDILDIELALKESGLCIPAHMVVNWSKWVKDYDENLFYFRVECLSWSKDKNDKFRLMYCTGRTALKANEPEVYRVLPDPEIEIDHAVPLIETKADVRYKMNGELHLLIGSIVDYFQLNTSEITETW